MKVVLAIDVGIRNLSMCVMSCTDRRDFETFEIKLWDTINTLENTSHFCRGILKNNKICNRKCAYKYNEYNENGEDNENGGDNVVYSCKAHFPKDRPIGPKITEKLIKNYPLQELTGAVLRKLRETYEENISIFEQVTDIVIELQPSINPKMKMMSHVIYGKLVELYGGKTTTSAATIKFVSASAKLKAYIGPLVVCTLKGAYAQRKWLSIQYTRWFLDNKFSEDQRQKWGHVLRGNKVDDACDTFLMSINAHCGIPKKSLLKEK